jgi:hypothetical protein
MVGKMVGISYLVHTFFFAHTFAQHFFLHFFFLPTRKEEGSSRVMMKTKGQRGRKLIIAKKKVAPSQSQSLPDTRKKMAMLQNRLDTLTMPHHTRERRLIQHEMSQLEAMHGNITTHQQVCEDIRQRKTFENREAREICECGHPYVIFESRLARCPKCKSSQGYINITLSASSFGSDPPQEMPIFHYRRINHFLDRLNNFQGHDNITVPEIVIQGVMEDFASHNTPKHKITSAAVRSVLRRLVIVDPDTKKKIVGRRWYEHTPLIASKITGIPPPKLTRDQVNDLKRMFLEIQEPFKKCCPKDRHNFSSYNYVLYKFFELKGLNEFLPFFPLLKGEDKLRKQDEIWSSICGELGWKFVKSI